MDIYIDRDELARGLARVGRGVLRSLLHAPRL